MSSEKVAVTFVVAATPVARVVGRVLTTLGAAVSPPCGVVDTVKELVAGEASMLPAASIARTLKG